MSDAHDHEPHGAHEMVGPAGWDAADAVKGDAPASSRVTDTGRPRRITDAFRILRAVREGGGVCADESAYSGLHAAAPVAFASEGGRRSRSVRARRDGQRRGARMLLFGCIYVVATAASAADSLANRAQPPPSFASGDAVRISVMADSTAFLDGLYHIDDSGDIFLPIVGRTRVVDQTVDELTAYLDSVFLKYLRYPDVRVQRMVRLSFLGGFHEPGLYYVDPRLSLWDALAQAGGPMRQDGLAKLRWQRGDYVVDKDLVPELRSGHSLVELGVESGDLIWVTDNPKRNGWEVFRDDIMPLLSLTISVLTAGLALYAVLEEDY